MKIGPVFRKITDLWNWQRDNLYGDENKAKIIRLPFQGFYGSWYSEELDNIEEREAENIADTEGVPVDVVADALYWTTDYAAAYRKIAAQYVEYFCDSLADEFGLQTAMQFESMQSPREYNFETDRVFAYIRLGHVKALFDKVDKERLSEKIKERFTSRSGFISFYSNDIADWLEKPLSQWDHNEVETILLALVEQCEDWEYTIFQSMQDHDSTFYQAWDDSVDWPAFEARIAEYKAEHGTPDESTNDGENSK